MGIDKLKGWLTVLGTMVPVIVWIARLDFRVTTAEKGREADTEDLRSLRERQTQLLTRVVTMESDMKHVRQGIDEIKKALKTRA